jgi:hypothetical protein
MKVDNMDEINNMMINEMSNTWMKLYVVFKSPHIVVLCTNLGKE